MEHPVPQPRQREATLRTPAGSGFVIRNGVPGDATRLAQFAARTFAESFGAENRPEDVVAHEAANYSPALQGAQLADPAMRNLLIESPDRLVGYAQLRSHAPPAIVLDRPVELWRFYIDRPFHGQGLAQRLMAAVHDAALELGAATLWLGVWERNARGIAFYLKSGFVERGTQDYWVGQDRQVDRIMVIPVRR
jgi:diamine N-acetyltransferase